MLARFLLRRQDPEYLEVVSPVVSAAAVSASVAPSPAEVPDVLRRSRRVRGLEAEFEGLSPVARRPRLK